MSHFTCYRDLIAPRRQAALAQGRSPYRNVRVEGQLVFNPVNLMLDAAVAGHSVAFVMEDHVIEQIARGTLVRVLED